MISLRRLPARAARSSIGAQNIRLTGFRTASLSTSTSTSTRPTHHTPAWRTLRTSPTSPSALTRALSRGYATPSSSSSSSLPTTPAADELIEEIQEQYFTARDEFEIATEETDKKSVYAVEDRAAARKELDRLKEMYAAALEGEAGEEIKRRIGQRVRELEGAVVALEERATEH